MSVRRGFGRGVDRGCAPGGLLRGRFARDGLSCALLSRRQDGSILRTKVRSSSQL